MHTLFCGSRRDSKVANPQLRGQSMQFLLNEPRELPVLPFHLPWPQEPRPAQVCQRLSEHPDDATCASEWAAALAMNTKTFHRQFHRYTGLTLGHWRQLDRLLLSLERLAPGVPPSSFYR
ncbi:helix-turn-helix transcriptional regulator (plasmid) [Mycetohabitans rhizoxinica]